ncbi:hypothetical protein [Vibrio brasiliensis]|uniref:hypothetical protein n=1 Tax=Vibrio brasiliensis TaxID=170652 RepID=UPI001EFCA5FF|nr:hypothetical protein [Vibrio brasiliensis]MCG9727196.1 hypothetical protein [Vibrio brasiliensis]|tara:strand:- start:69 stop:665 length:597 start_codon:yes stop_codon:yes gene_type:complete
MRYSFLFLLLITATAQSQQDNSKFKFNQDYIYLGGSFNRVTNLSTTSNSYEFGPGISLSVGHSWVSGSKWNFNWELEYFNMGELDLENTSSSEPYDVGTGASALSISFKPVFRPSGSGFFIGGLAGFGKYTFEKNRLSLDATHGHDVTESDYGMAMGGELGYEFDRLILSAGYRSMSSTMFGQTVNMSSLSFGGRYKF